MACSTRPGAALRAEGHVVSTLGSTPHATHIAPAPLASSEGLDEALDDDVVAEDLLAPRPEHVHRLAVLCTHSARGGQPTCATPPPTAL
jgi:hypothetical protein